MKFYRGTAIRKIKSHIKAAIPAGTFGKRKFIIGARAGPPYSSEIKLIEPLIEKIPIPSYALGGKADNCNRLLETIVGRDYLPVIATKQSRRYSNPAIPCAKDRNISRRSKQSITKMTLIEGFLAILIRHYPAASGSSTKISPQSSSCCAWRYSTLPSWTNCKNPEY